MEVYSAIDTPSFQSDRSLSHAEVPLHRAVLLPAADAERLPKELIWLFLALCILPEFLSLTGVSFGLPTPHIEVPALARLGDQAELLNQLYVLLEGSFLHNLLEWTAVCMALGTAALAFIHFRLTGTVLVPVIGAALMFSGLFDGFHTLASDHLLRRVADLDQFIPFTWAASRLFNWAVLAAGSVAVLLHKAPDNHAGRRFILVMLASFTVCFAVCIWYATSSRLPQSMFPNWPVPRPYDLALATLDITVGWPLFRALDKVHKTQFSHALTVSVLPHIATQLHMALGSRALYDDHFNIAHFMKIVAYCVPLSGLLLDYIKTYRSQSLMSQLSIANARLEDQRAELRVVNDRLEEEVLERIRAAEILALTARELEAARDTAMKANSAKSQFIANMSHELRTPLNAILGFSQLLQIEMKDQGISFWNEEVRKIERAGTRLLLLINDVLDLSKIEAGKMHLDPESFEIADLMSEVVSELGPAAAQHRNEIRGVAQPAILYADRMRLQQCLLNLAGNACKFTQDGRVSLEGRLTPGAAWYQVEVTDTGIGISIEDLGRLFVDFTQGDSSATKKYGGTGLGLSISRSLCRLMGGDITVRSVLGKGSTFTLQIPVGDSASESLAESSAVEI